MAGKKSKLSREDAKQLYADLERTMKGMKKPTPQGGGEVDPSVAKDIAMAIKESMRKDDEIMKGAALKGSAPKQKEKSSVTEGIRSTISPFLSTPAPKRSGASAALVLVAFIAIAKLSFSVLEYSGIAKIEDAQASLNTAAMRQPFQAPYYTREEVGILTQLDARRVELEARRKKLEQREQELQKKDRAFAVKLAEIRDLTEKLKSSRDKDDQKRSGQLEQLASVYSSMNPKEASLLIEQLDVTIALGLLERMPEKRIGQILSLMSPDRALTITRMLSGRKDH